MSKIYRFLTAPDSSDFCHKVTKALSEGWQLYGDPTIVFDASEGKRVCGQAVVKDSDDAYDPARKLGEY